jgi:tripartite-type tricarboxylate transporter receptor subunit TctC
MIASPIAARGLACGPMKRRQFLWLAGGIALLCSPPSAWSQSYPARTIKLVVPFGPGGPNDMFGRVAAHIIESALGQSVVIENRPGAGGAVGTKAVATAEPDGYTLLLANTATLGVIPAWVKSPGYDPLKSFAAVAKIGNSTLVMVTPASLSAGSVGEFINAARTQPGKFNYASAGKGNLTHLVAEAFKAKTQTDIVHVAYRGAGDLITAVLTEQVQLAFPEISLAMPMVREGRIRALAVISAERNRLLPDVPTMQECGIPDFVYPFWAGVVAPAATPPDVIDRLNAALQAGLRATHVEETISSVGAEVDTGPAQAFSQFIAAETERWAELVRAIGLKQE